MFAKTKICNHIVKQICQIKLEINMFEEQTEILQKLLLFFF